MTQNQQNAKSSLHRLLLLSLRSQSTPLLTTNKKYTQISNKSGIKNSSCNKNSLIRHQLRILIQRNTAISRQTAIQSKNAEWQIVSFMWANQQCLMSHTTHNRVILETCFSRQSIVLVLTTKNEKAKHCIHLKHKNKHKKPALAKL